MTEIQRNHIYTGDALEVAKMLPDGSIHCIITSPPYYGLRDYGVEGQGGLQETPQQYVEWLMVLFRELRRVLRDDGVLWLNLGDSYNTDGTASMERTKTSGIGLTPYNAKEYSVSTKRTLLSLERKQLLGIPWHVAFALQADGWILRSDIIWSKGAPMPESVRDRPTKSHEYVFLLSKSPRYFYDADSIREPHADATLPRYQRGVSENNKYASGASGSIAYAMSKPRVNVRKMTGTGYGGDGNGFKGHSGYFRPDGSVMMNPLGRNKRSVWTINPKGNKRKHYAAFPEALVEPMILAGCPKQCCAKCGAPYGRVTEPTLEHQQFKANEVARRGRMRDDTPEKYGLSEGKSNRSVTASFVTLGFIPTCDCAADSQPGIVYDPFMGSGTVAVVARRLGRDYAGSELNPKYVAMALRRLAGTPKAKDGKTLEDREDEDKPKTLSMFGENDASSL